MTDWAQYSREVQAASDAGWKQQKAEIDALKKQLREAQSALRAEREKALREALVALQGAGSFGRTASEKHAALEQYCLCRDAILALIGEKP